MMTMKTLTLASVAALMLGTAPVLAQSAPGALAADDQAAAAEHNEGTAANAGHAEPHIQDVQFSFEGPFGTSTSTSSSAACRCSPRSARPATG